MSLKDPSQRNFQKFKKNSPNDSTLCKYQVGSKSFGKIQSAYHNGNLYCGPAKRKSENVSSRRETEAIKF
jgi:hypothetical protein